MSDLPETSTAPDREELEREISRLRERVATLEADISSDPRQSPAQLLASLEHAPEMEQRLRLALEGSGLAVYELDLVAGKGSWSRSAFEILGIEPPEDLTGTYGLWRDSVHPDDVARAEAALADAESHGGPWTLEHRIVRQDTGETRWLSAYGQITRRGEARISTGVAVDVTDRKVTQERLEQHSRTLQTLNEIGAIVAAELDIDRIVQSVTDAGVELTGAQFGAFFYSVHAESGEVMTLYTLSGAARSDFEQFPHPRATEVFKPTFDGTAIVRSDDITADPRYGKNEPYHGMPANHLPVRSYLAVPVKSRSGEVIGGLFFGHERAGVFTENHEQLIVGIAPQAAVAMDNARLYREAQHEIGRRKRAEAHQQLLINELNHRVKNTLAIVQSLAMQSFRPGLSPEQGKSAFDARLAALSSAHSLLTRQNWEQASLQETLRSAVEATVGEDMRRVHLDGPDTNLLPQTALSVAMAIHELSTNAIKYGALSNGDGKVSLTWTLDDGVDSGELAIRWEESGGPPVAAPPTRGFGIRLLERGLSSEFAGGAAIDFAPGGVVCTMRIVRPASAQ